MSGRLGVATFAISLGGFFSRRAGSPERAAEAPPAWTGALQYARHHGRAAIGIQVEVRHVEQPQRRHAQAKNRQPARLNLGKQNANQRRRFRNP